MQPLEPQDPHGHPHNDAPAYRSSTLRAPRSAPLPAQGMEPTALPLDAARSRVEAVDADLLNSAGDRGSPIGERIIVAGRVLEGAAPLAGALVEVWQANAAGRYAHAADQHDAPLDDNFLGAGRAVTDAGGEFRFVTLRPGAYPWANHDNAWRPPHIHFSVLGPRIEQRLVTQMYFPGDPLLEHDPIYQSVPVEARERLVAAFDIELTEPEFALGYRFDIVLRGPDATPEAR